MVYDMLSGDIGDFLASWYGILLFVLIDAVAVVLIAAASYRWFFKYFLDFLCGLVATVATAPVWLTVAIISKAHIIKTNEYQSVFTCRYVAGKGGKTIALHSFTVTDGLEGELTELGAFLRKTGIEKLPRAFDLLTLKTSIVGVKPLSLADEKFIAEKDYDRFSARPGYFNPLLVFGPKGKADYEDMFASDKLYAKKCDLFLDLKILLTAFVRKIRGEKEDVFGETAQKDYCEVLLERGKIERRDYEEVRAEEKYPMEDESEGEGDDIRRHE